MNQIVSITEAMHIWPAGGGGGLASYYIYKKYICAMQSQKAVSPYLSIKQMQPLGFESSHIYLCFAKSKGSIS